MSLWGKRFRCRVFVVESVGLLCFLVSPDTLDESNFSTSPSSTGPFSGNSRNFVDCSLRLWRKRLVFFGIFSPEQYSDGPASSDHNYCRCSAFSFSGPIAGARHFGFFFARPRALGFLMRRARSSRGFLTAGSAKRRHRGRGSPSRTGSTTHEAERKQRATAAARNPTGGGSAGTGEHSDQVKA